VADVRKNWAGVGGGGGREERTGAILRTFGVAFFPVPPVLAIRPVLC